MNEPERPKREPLDPDEITRLLKAGARRPRPWSLVLVIVLLLLCALPIGLLTWWVWPRPAPPRLLVVAFDQLAHSEEVVPLRAQLLPAEDKDATLGGQRLTFSSVGVAAPGGAGAWQDDATSSDDGTAGVEWPAPATTTAREFLVRLTPPGQTKGAESRAQVFTWPRATPVLLIEVERALTDAAAQAWVTQSMSAIRRLPGAAEALMACRQRKYQIVYVALAADGPLPYQKVRDWIRLRPVGKEQRFPDGPVLGRLSVTTDPDEGQARRALLGGLTKRFRGPTAAVAGRELTAAAFRDAGLRTFLLTKDGAAPAGVTALKSWSELTTHLDDK
jgi:hypothetical protein